MPNAKVDLAAAFFCERIIEDKTGVISAIRIIDTLKVAAVGLPTPPPAVLAQVTLFVSLRSGNTSGKYEVSIRGFKPSGEELKFRLGATADLLPLQPIPISLTAETPSSVNLIANLNLMIEESGFYHFEVLVDGEPISRIPLRLLRESSDTAAEN